MKALTLTQIKAPLELKQRDDLAPGKGEVIVRLKAAALNRRDYWITQGMYPGIEPPVVLGSDGAGVVTSCGDGVDESWLGQEVIINPGMDWGDCRKVQSNDFSILGLPRDGTFASEVAVPACQLHDRPTHLDWNEAAALPLAGVTAYRALFTQGELKADDTVLITGIGGGVATFALQFAIAAGATAWVTSSSADKIERAISLGAQGGFDYTDDNWSKAFAKQAGAANVIIDSAGGSGYNALLQVAAPGARIVNYGSTAGAPEKLDMFKLFWKQLRIVGSTMGSPEDFADMLVFTSTYKIRPLIERVVGLDDGNEAVAQMGTSPQFGKYVLTIE